MKNKEHFVGNCHYFFQVLAPNTSFPQACRMNMNLNSPMKSMFKSAQGTKLKDRITPHVTNFFRLRLTIEKQEGKRKYKSDGAVMVSEFVCMYVCSCTVSE